MVFSGKGKSSKSKDSQNLLSDPEMKDKYINALEKYLTGFVEFIVSDEPITDFGESAEKALKQLTGNVKLEITMRIEATRYVKRGKTVILREALPDSDPESFPSLWFEEFNSSILEDIGNDWISILEEV